MEQDSESTAKLIPGGPAIVPPDRHHHRRRGRPDRRRREAGLDTYITGEGAHHTYFDAMEFGVNAIYAGHYATETVGVKALGGASLEAVRDSLGIPRSSNRALSE